MAYHVRKSELTAEATRKCRKCRKRHKVVTSRGRGWWICWRFSLARSLQGLPPKMIRRNQFHNGLAAVRTADAVAEALVGSQVSVPPAPKRLPRDGERRLIAELIAGALL